MFWGLLGLLYRQLTCLESYCKLSFSCVIQLLGSLILCLSADVSLVWCPGGLPCACKIYKSASMWVEMDLVTEFFFLWGISLFLTALSAWGSILIFQAFYYPSWAQLGKSIRFTDLAPCYSLKRRFLAGPWLPFQHAVCGFLQTYVVQLSAGDFSILCSEFECHFYSSCAVRKLYISSCFPNSKLWYPAPLAGEALGFFSATIFAAIALGLRFSQVKKPHTQLFLPLRVIAFEIYPFPSFCKHCL